MAYNFLGLVNELAKRVNEVELTSSNFSTAVGFYNHAKEAVNRAISDIDIRERFWAFNFSQGTQVLTAGTMKYAFPADYKIIDFDSFVLVESSALNVETIRLRPLSYDDYKQTYVWYEHSEDTNTRNIPTYVVKSPSNEFIVVPNPDKAYTVKFDYFTRMPRLENFDDVPRLPEVYRIAIINGAMRDVSLFRENPENATYYEDQFTKNIEDMRIAEINRDYYVRASADFNTRFGYRKGFISYA